MLLLYEWDRDVVRFLWLKDIAELRSYFGNLLILRIASVPLGVIESPF